MLCEGVQLVLETHSWWEVISAVSGVVDCDRVVGRGVSKRGLDVCHCLPLFANICANGSSHLCLKVKENNYRGHGDSVDQLCWHPTNPDLFVTASGDKTVRVWDVRTTKCIATVNTKGQWTYRPPDHRDHRVVRVVNINQSITFIFPRETLRFPSCTVTTSIHKSQLQG